MQPLNYSSWNDNSNDITRKRTPTMRKTVKKMAGNGATGATDDLEVSNSVGSNTSYLDEIPTGISKLQTETRERDQRINQLLETMTTIDADNDGSNLANFQPPPKPEMSMKKSSSDAIANYGANVGVGMTADRPIEYLENEYQVPHPSAATAQSVLQRPLNGASRAAGGGYTSVDFDRQTTEYSNYNHVYDPNRVVHKPYANRGGVGIAGAASGGIPGISDELMKKVNYMIHMLEQQGIEKTANITEEFILYTFLGVFIIYIVDSFSRSGRYIR